MMNEPWSKKHKRVFKNCKFSLSNSFSQPLSQPELEEYVRKAQPEDTTLLDMYRNHDLQYVPNGGSIDLREDVARVVYNNELSAENILIFPGGQVALQTAALAFASGYHSIVFTPGYQSTIESPQWAVNNKGVTEIPRRPENNWQVDTKKLKEAIRDDTKFLILNEPYNPGGIVMTRELQQEIIEICEENDIVILCDEVYRLLEHDPIDRIPTMACSYKKGISAVTMSKPWGGCGITIGWLACSDLNLVQKLIDVQYFGTACPGRSSEIQARMVLTASDAIIKDRIAIIKKNKKLLQNFIENKFSEWFAWKRPNAGAIAFVKFKGPWTSEELGRHLADVGISIKPAYCFSRDVSSDFEDYFRIGFGEIKMPLALEEFSKFITDHEEVWRNEMSS